MVVQPNALRNELALEIRRWYPANTWTEALAAADAAIAGLIAGDSSLPVEHHPLVLFIANTFIVPWSWAGAAYNTILTGGVPTVPAALTSLVATPFSSTQNNVTWVNNSLTALSVRLERSPTGAAPWTVVTGAGALPANAVSFSHTGLVANTLVYYRAFAVNAVGDSLPSNIDDARTPFTGFVTVWRTTAAAETVTVPVSGGGYNCTVNWGDGTANTVYTTGVLNHVYAVAGDYTVTITGTFPKILFNNGGDKLKLIKILNWGAVGWALNGLTTAFYGCANLNQVSATDAVNLPGGSWLNVFRDCGSLPSVNLTGYIGATASLVSAFASTNSLHTLIIPTLISATTTSVASMCSICPVLTTLDISGAVSPAITATQSMIANCPMLTTIVFPVGWVTTAVTGMNTMFDQSLLVNPNVAGFDVGLVTTATNMLRNTSFSNANYNALLIAWAAQSPDLKNGVPFGAGGAKYSAGAATTARGVLTGTHTWAITDGGPAALLVNDEMQGPVEDVSTRVLNVDPLGNGWNVLTGSADVGEGQTVVGPGGVRAVINAGSPNVVITAVVQAFAPVGLMFRSRVGGVRSMRVLLGTGGTMELQRVGNGGVVTVVASVAAMPAADTEEHHLQIWVDAASRIIVYFDGVPLIDVVDAYQMNRPWHGILAGPGAVYLREFSIAEYPA